MKTCKGIENFPSHPRAVAVGVFDGVHLGHCEVVRRALAAAAQDGLTSAVLTFEPHPSVVLDPANAAKMLTTLDTKREYIAELGVDELLVLQFDRELAKLSPREFCTEVLSGAVSARHVAVGKNFHFGRAAKGNFETLQIEGSKLGFVADVVDLVSSNGQRVSSSRIRELVAAGQVSDAAKLLGRPFRLEGEVVYGDGRGRQIGVPTANLKSDPSVLKPADGIYAAWAGQRWAAVSVGVRPTFQSSSGRVVEAHILDFDEDLYGSVLQLDLVERLRDEKRFDSVEALVDQMQLDIKQIRSLLEAS